MQQEELVNKIIRYLRNELNHITDPRERENRHAIIDYFVKCGGICHGLSTLWVYGKKLSDEAQLSPNPSNDSAKDDISFFNHVQNLLKSWDGFTPFDPIQKRDIEGFISHVLLYQRFDLMDAWTSNKNNSKLLNNFTQKDINAVLEDTKRGRAISSFTQNEVPLTKLMLADRLSKLIKPHSLAIISLIGDESGHAMSFYQNASDKKIFFYDSNAEEEVVVNDEKELVDCFWKNINPSHLRESASNSALSDSVLRNTRINIFRFASDPVYNYSVDKADQIQDEEFVSLFENAPEFLAAVRVDKQFQRLVDALNPKQVVRLLQNQNIHPELNTLLFCVVYSLCTINPH